MLRMDFDITIGRYRLKMVDQVKVKHSVEQLSDTATITLPAMVEGKALEVESKLHAGDSVTIRLGYDGNLQTEFAGYLKAINTDGGNLTLECEDAIYLFDKKVDDVELTEISMKALLEKVVAQVDPSYQVQTEFDFTWKKFVFSYPTETEYADGGSTLNPKQVLSALDAVLQNAICPGLGPNRGLRFRPEHRVIQPEVSQERGQKT